MVNLPSNYSTMEKIEKKYALVTGGSSGMGLDYVRQLAGMGYNVIIVALFQNETDAVQQDMKKQYPDLDFISIGIDLSTLEAPKTVYDKVCEAIGEDGFVEVLINNAGLLAPVHFRNMNERQVSSIIMVHNHATAMLCHYFLPAMLERKKGYILNISSLAAWLPYPFISTYASTKAFTKTFTRALRTECKRSGVKAAAIYFGAVDTPLYKLSPKLRKLARGLGIMISPQKATRIALKMLFKGRTGRMPGFINQFVVFIAPVLRPWFIGVLDRKITSHWKLK